MPFRVTDGSTSARLSSQVAATRQRIEAAQERVATSKRINRPSDDPVGTEAVVRIRTTQTTIDKFRRSAGSATTTLNTADTVLESYQQLLDRATTAVQEGASGASGVSGREALAAELEGLRTRAIATANTRAVDTRYIFGGTRQNVPPVDPTTGAPAAGATSRAQLQLEPGGSPVEIGTIAEPIFNSPSGTVFDTLARAAAALRGTGDQAADRATINSTLVQLEDFSGRATSARIQVGVGLSRVDIASQRLDQDYLSLETNVEMLEAADFAEAATDLVEEQRSLEAILQASSRGNRRTLIDFLG